MFASEYGYDYDQFLSLTPKIIRSMMEVMGIRKHNEFAASAALHGQKVKTKSIRAKTQKISDEQYEHMKAATKEALSRKFNNG